MAMVVVDDSCLKQADSQPKSGGLVWGSAATWRCSTFIKWTEWTLTMTWWSWWQHYKYRPGYYYYYYYYTRIRCFGSTVSWGECRVRTCWRRRRRLGRSASRRWRWLAPTAWLGPGSVSATDGRSHPARVSAVRCWFLQTRRINAHCTIGADIGFEPNLGLGIRKLGLGTRN